jgi:acyl-CoA thioester hydrolase
MTTTRDRFPHFIQEQVRWGDMDALGHVNNATYFVYCESARMSFFKAIDLEALTAGGSLGPALVTATCNFKQQVKHPATLDIGLVVSRIGGKSFTLEYGLFEGERLVADGSSVVVWVNYAEGSSQALPEPLRTSLTTFQLDGSG